MSKFIKVALVAFVVANAGCTNSNNEALCLNYANQASEAVKYKGAGIGQELQLGAIEALRGKRDDTIISNYILITKTVFTLELSSKEASNMVYAQCKAGVYK
jgi:hypothetical protein